MTFTPPATLPDVVPAEGPCQPWTDLVTARNQCGVPVTEISDEAFEFGIELASLVLWAASGRRYGLCERIVRPCYSGEHSNGFRRSTSYRAPASYPPILPVAGTLGPVDTYQSWGLNGGCGCQLPTLELPGPIAWVTEVMVDGTAAPLTAVKIKTGQHGGRRHLLRVDGESWPCCQNLEGDPAVVSGDGCPAWQVTYIQGRPVPNAGATIAGVLAEQFARVRCGADCDNRMVPGLTRVSRRGVTREYSPQDLVDPETGQTRTGLPGVDAWINAVNPYRRVRPSTILRADDPERRRLWSWVDAV